MSAAAPDLDLSKVAERMCIALGRGALASIERLTGGKNNRVYQINFAGDEKLVLKGYHADPRDPRDRLAAEWDFLTYVWQRGVRSVPEPLLQDKAAHAAIYTFAPGRKLGAAEIAQSHIDQAADFILAANGPPRAVDLLRPGSEACFSLANHVATVDRRTARLSSLDGTAPHRDRAETLVRERLKPAWAEARARIVSDPGYGDALELGQQIASPSDFGFHNALVDPSDRAIFIDFEYAGRDDPAKLVSDFFCCPEIPVPLKFRAGFVESLARNLGLDNAFRRRADLLLDAYRIKWTCIVLNDFLPLGAARRDFAESGEREARCLAQLDKAAAKLDEIGQI